MEESQTDILIIGTSLTAIGLALSLGKKGRDVTIAETVFEGVIRGYYKVGSTPLNAAPLDGSEFDTMMTSEFKKAGVTYIPWIFHIQNIAFSEDMQTVTITSMHNQIIANQVYFMPNSSVLRGIPPLSNDLIADCWSACSWSDSFFFRDKKTGVYGNGSWAANQALMAAYFGCEVSIFNPDATFIADAYLLEELQKHNIPVINNCANFNLVTNDKKLEKVTFDSDDEPQEHVCGYLFEGRVETEHADALKLFPTSEKVKVLINDSLLFNHAEAFNLGQEMSLTVS